MSDTRMRLRGILSQDFIDEARLGISTAPACGSSVGRRRRKPRTQLLKNAAFAAVARTLLSHLHLGARRLAALGRGSAATREKSPQRSDREAIAGAQRPNGCNVRSHTPATGSRLAGLALEMPPAHTCASRKTAHEKR